MELIVRKLNPAEFEGKLPYISDGFCPDPKSSIALVAEIDNEIVGRVFLVAPAHIEGPWVKENWRSHNLGMGIGKQLIESAEYEAKAVGITKLFAYGTPLTVSALIRLRFKPVPLMTIWEKEI